MMEVMLEKVVLLIQKDQLFVWKLKIFPIRQINRIFHQPLSDQETNINTNAFINFRQNKFTQIKLL